jgi:hypothetical protein
MKHRKRATTGCATDGIGAPFLQWPAGPLEQEDCRRVYASCPPRRKPDSGFASPYWMSSRRSPRGRPVVRSGAPIVAAPSSELGRRTERGRVHRRHRSRGPDSDTRNPIEAVLGPNPDLCTRHPSRICSARLPTRATGLNSQAIQCSCVDLAEEVLSCGMLRAWDNEDGVNPMLWRPAAKRAGW